MVYWFGMVSAKTNKMNSLLAEENVTKVVSIASRIWMVVSLASVLVVSVT